MYDRNIDISQDFISPVGHTTQRGVGINFHCLNFFSLYNGGKECGVHF